MSDLDNILFDLAYQEGKSVSECLYDVYEKGRADAIDEFLTKAKKIIRHEVTNAYDYGIVEFNHFAIVENGKTVLTERPFEISAEYIIQLLEQVKEQSNE